MNFEHGLHNFVWIDKDCRYIEMEFYDIAWLDKYAMKCLLDRKIED